MASEQFSLCWDNFHKNMSSGMQSLLETEDLVDVTLAVEGRYLKAHKMVLSVCSPYFRELFQTNPCKHPIVFMKDVSYIALSDLLQFMYQGEVQVAQENLSTFIKTAEALQIKGLTGDSNNQNEVESTESNETDKVVETIKRTHEVMSSKPVPAARVKKPAGPASKRPRFTLPPTEPSASVNPVACSTPVVATTAKTEVSSASAAPTSEEIIQFKMEPSESGEQTQIEGIDESQGDRYDESAVDDIQDDTEDYTLMEAGEDEPKAGTSADGMGDSQDFQIKSLSLLLQIREQNDQILSILKKRHKPSTSLYTTLPADLPIVLPLKAHNDVDSLESYLEKDKDNCTALSLYFASIGGKDVGSRVNNVLRHLFTNSLATAYSFYGQRNEKKALNVLRLKNVIIDAVKIGLPGSTEIDIENAIKIWLKHARGRVLAEIKKKSTIKSDNLK